MSPPPVSRNMRRTSFATLLLATTLGVAQGSFVNFEFAPVVGTHDLLES